MPDISTIVSQLVKTTNSGLDQATLDAIVIDYDNGMSDSLIVSEVNDNSAIYGYDTVTLSQVDSILNAIQQMVGQGGSVGTAAAGVIQDHMQAVGDTPVSVQGFWGALGTLMGGPTTTVTTTPALTAPGLTGGTNVSTGSPGSGSLSAIEIILIAIAAIVALMLVFQIVRAV